MEDLEPHITVDIWTWMKFLWQNGQEYRTTNHSCIIDQWQLDMEWNTRTERVRVIFPNQQTLSMFLLKYSNNHLLKDWLTL